MAAFSSIMTALAVGGGVASEISKNVKARDVKRKIGKQEEAQKKIIAEQKAVELEERKRLIDVQREQLIPSLVGGGINPTGATGRSGINLTGGILG